MSLSRLEGLKILNNISLTAVVSKKLSERTVKQGTLKLTEYELTDKNLDTIKLTLFAGQVDSVKVGDKIKIINANRNEFRSEISLTVPRWGSITVEDSN